MNFILYGDEKFLLDKKLNSLKKKYHIHDEDMNLMTYWCNETPMSEIIDDALTPPFLTEYKMIIMRNPLFLTNTKQKNVTDNDMKLLLDYTSHDNPSTILVIYHDGKNFDERKKVVKTLKKQCQVYLAQPLTSQQLYKTVREGFKNRHCTIDDDALDLFLSRMSNNLYLISKEVDKLALYSKHIQLKDIDLLVSKRVEDNVYELTNAYLNKDIGECFRIYEDLMKMNEQPIKLIIMIANSLRLLYQVKFLDRKGYNDLEIANLLTINQFRIKYIRRDGQKFDLFEILDKIEELSDLDIAIKTGRVNGYKGLELFLLKME